MQSMITINQVLQYLHLSPEHHWNQFTLKTVEYFDANLLNLYYHDDLSESEVLYFEARDLESLDNISFNVFRNSTSIIVQPILMININGLELFGSKVNEYYIQSISETLKILLRVSIDINILNAFISGILSQLWDIKPNYE